MTPREYLERIKDLVAAGQDQEALDLSAELWPGMSAELSAEELVLASDLMHVAQRAADSVEPSLVQPRR